MAESSVEDYVQELKNRFLECPICFEVFDEGLKQPRILPCLHTYCLECLQKLLKEDKVVCSLCNKDCKVGENKLDEFPKDNTRRDLLDYVCAKLEPSKVFCENCDERQQAVYRCKECSQLMCQSCYNAHQTMKSSKDHNSFRLDSGEPTRQNLHEFIRHDTCSVPGHENESLKLFCKSDSCLTPICFVCAFSSHKNHVTADVNEIYVERKKVIEEAKLKLEDRQNCVSTVIQNVEDALTALKTNAEKADESVVSAFDECIRDLENRKGQLRKEIQYRREEKEKNLQVQIKELTMFSENVKSGCDFLNQYLSYKNAPKFLHVAPLILERFSNLQNQELDSEPLETPELQFKNTFMEREFKKHSLRMGELEYPPKLPDTPPPDFLPNLTKPDNGHFETALNSLLDDNEDDEVFVSKENGKIETDKEQKCSIETKYSEQEIADDTCKSLQDDKETDRSEQDKHDKPNLEHAVTKAEIEAPRADIKLSNGKEEHHMREFEEDEVPGSENITDEEKSKATEFQPQMQENYTESSIDKTGTTPEQLNVTNEQNGNGPELTHTSPIAETVNTQKKSKPVPGSRRKFSSKDDRKGEKIRQRPKTPPMLSPATVDVDFNDQQSQTTQLVNVDQRSGSPPMPESEQNASPTVEEVNTSRSTPVISSEISQNRMPYAKDIRKTRIRPKTLPMVSPTSTHATPRSQTPPVSLSEIKSNQSPVAEQNVLPAVEEAITPRPPAVPAQHQEATQFRGPFFTREFYLDDKTLPTDFCLSQDRRTLSNYQRGTHKHLLLTDQEPNTYVGVIASQGFKLPDNIYFEVEVTYSARRSGYPVEVFEMWFSQQDDINAGQITDERKYKVTLNNPSKLAEGILSVNFNGRDVALPRGKVILAVHINTQKQRIVVVERKKGIHIGKVEGVDFSQEWWPVFQISKEKAVNASMTLNTGHSIEKIPWKLLKQ